MCLLTLPVEMKTPLFGRGYTPSCIIFNPIWSVVMVPAACWLPSDVLLSIWFNTISSISHKKKKKAGDHHWSRYTVSDHYDQRKMESFLYFKPIIISAGIYIKQFTYLDFISERTCQSLTACRLKIL